MSYKWITKYNSPNFTPGSQTRSVWGVDRKIKNIAIHWWGDPNTKPTFEGVISHFENPNSGVSAHIVATGTGRQAACLVNFDDNSWATNSDNPYSISIECDPRCRAEDYDVVAEVIANIRSAFGNLPLVPHKQFVATTCPGNYDLNKLDKLARTKDGSGDWGKVKDKVTVTTKTETKTEAIKYTSVKKDDPTLEKGKTKVQTKGVNGVRTIKYTVTYTNGKETKRVVASNTVTKAAVDEVVLVGTYVKPTDPEQGSESSPTVSLDEKSTTLLKDVQKLLQSLLDALKRIFNVGD